MKALLLVLSLCTILQSCASREAIFELDPAQSMLIYGKGPGQDAAENPYAGEDCIAVVKNLGEESVGVRVQYQGKIVELLEVAPREKQVVDLPKDHEIYLDCDAVAKAKIVFKSDKVAG